MERIGLLVLLQARAGKENAVEAFLKSAEPLVLQERGTLSWYAFKAGPSTFGIFDTFADEEGRSAHLNGDIAKALLSSAEELFATPPQIQMIEILASKTSKV
jgi:quinol monooxygenase YgiN